MIDKKKTFRIKNNSYSIGNTFVVAEAGSNHNQSLKLAKKLIDIAALAKCNAIKFQVFTADKIIQKKFKGWKILKKLEFNTSWLKYLKKYSNKKKLLFGISVFDVELVKRLKKQDVDFIKIASTEIQDLDLIENAAKKKVPIILSTGASNLVDISNAYECVKKFNKNFAFLHCVSIYPAKPSQLNLNMINSMRKFLGVPIGYSDHSSSINIPSIAVSKGACIIEKHITFNKKAKGPDHKFSLNENELIQMVRIIRETEASFGKKIKEPAIKNERKNLARRLVTKLSLRHGERIKEKHIVILRADEKGILPADKNKIIGLKINRSKKMNEILKWSDFK